jgi:hypothetical protein
MAHTFKVGDIVTGALGESGKSSAYVGEVRRIAAVFDKPDCFGDDIAIQRLWHHDRDFMNLCFTTKSKYFKLVVPAEFVSTITGSQPLPQAPISHTIYSPPATVVFWSDGTKTVAKCAPHERFDREKGLAICCAKKLLGDGYAEAFKEFREPANRVLSIDEVHALRDGTKLYVEIKPSAFSGEGVHWKSGSKLIAQNGCFWLIDKESEDVWPMAKWARVWLLPRKPTDAELRANPWPKREG